MLFELKVAIKVLTKYARHTANVLLANEGVQKIEPHQTGTD